ncbi:MAG: GxxExxY protein [Planctomycetota bacterium]|nr:MAG: GxxExxY protein [Planctomycetota bacterium]REJ91193.1 MAG: GxxExxY protein [Planctomycetota bacterium]REK20396.1 MAG: GxxExxY protein [Planctomycetota bacterium]REK26893.1 MAG: GxxExxY protein [Planctomycetota bacterium]
MLHEDVTGIVIEEFFNVHNSLGSGFLERVYENSLALRLRKRGLRVQTQHPIQVHFESEIVGDYFADLLVEECVIVEIKAAKSISDAHEAQLVNYLRATSKEVGLILNFGPKATFKRKILTNDRKGRPP